MVCWLGCLGERTGAVLPCDALVEHGPRRLLDGAHGGMEDGGYGGGTSTGVLVLKVESVEMVVQMLVVEIIMDQVEVRNLQTLMKS